MVKHSHAWGSEARSLAQSIGAALRAKSAKSIFVFTGGEYVDMRLARGTTQPGLDKSPKCNLGVHTKHMRARHCSHRAKQIKKVQLWATTKTAGATLLDHGLNKRKIYLGIHEKHAGTRWLNQGLENTRKSVKINENQRKPTTIHENP